MIEILAVLTNVEYDRFRERLSCSLQPCPRSKWFPKDDRNLYLDQGPGTLRFCSPYAYKHVQFIDVKVLRIGDSVRLEWIPPSNESLCRASILALGVSIYLLTLFALILVTRSGSALLFHAGILLVFLLTVKVDKAVREALAKRVREVINTTVYEIRSKK